ncbi:shikimate kinase [Methylobrevis albus]|uniref:Shikimate kinase n=1 Tax=Methylobrevis albus TaxID=2793297 RepID=A0A931I431_9HYPH|nr:shikimate kinase [Methylobrevis albus]MBH0238891.1 shikimate kinase [Methylobrevis albus]
MRAGTYRPQRTRSDAGRGGRAGPGGPQATLPALRRGLGDRFLVLVGMMGSGKSSVGRRLGRALDLGFVDTDAEIEKAARMTVREIFETYGEPHFRALEERVVARVMAGPPSVIALGGGAWLSDATRRLVRERGLSVWLDVDIETLVARVGRRTSRPLADGDARGKLAALDAVRRSVYAEADVSVRAGDLPQEAMLARVTAALATHLGGPAGRTPPA